VAALAGCFDNIKTRLPSAFEIESAAAISEIGIVGNVVVGAVVATLRFVGRFYLHGWSVQVQDRCFKIIALKSG